LFEFLRITLILPKFDGQQLEGKEKILVSGTKASAFKFQNRVCLRKIDLTL
jgi:hypothetical protein